MKFACGCCIVEMTGKCPIRVYYNGHEYESIRALAHDLDMNPVTLQDRLKNGQCIAAPVQPKPWSKKKHGTARFPSDKRLAAQTALCNQFLGKARPV